MKLPFPKSKIFVFVLFSSLLFSCQNIQTSVFDYDKELKTLQTEIQKLPSSNLKTQILWRTKKILIRDTFSLQNAGLHLVDSLKAEIINSEYHSNYIRQLQLEELNEIQISDRIEAYKFSYARSFSDDLVFVTVYTQDNINPTVKAQVVEISRGCNPVSGNKEINGSCFKIKLNISTPIKQKEWDRLKKLVKESGFWTFKSKDYSDDVILDGSDWIIESTKLIESTIGEDSLTYKRLYGISPDEYSPIKKIGEYLLGLVDYNWGKIY